jgi:long-chain acyl-CoA synthetase
MSAFAITMIVVNLIMYKMAKKDPNNLFCYISEQIEKRPNDVALMYYGIPYTYCKLGNMISNLTIRLHHFGIKSGDVVSMALPTSPESIALVYSLNRLGAVACLIDVRFTIEQVTSIVSNTHSRMLFVMSHQINSIANSSPCINVEHIVSVGGYESLPKEWASLYANRDSSNGKIEYSKDRKIMKWDTFYVDSPEKTTEIYEWHKTEPQLIFQTSGTTGISKSVVLTGENIEQSRISTLRIMNSATFNDTVLNLIPIFAFYGFLTSVHLPLSYGMKVIVIPIWKPYNFIKLISRYKPQHIFTVPSSWDTIYNPENQSYILNSLKTIVVAGDIVNPIYEHDINDYLQTHGCNFNITKVYGMTETAGIIAATPKTSKHRYDVGYSGQIVVDCQIKIIDGEVCICPAMKFHGYVNNPQATEQLIREHDGKMWIHTGDIGRLTESGELYIVGRKKRMIVRYDGTKIFPIEIEVALLKCPCVRACAAVGATDPLHPQSGVPIVYVVLQDSNQSNRIAVSQYCKDHLPVYLCPERIEFVEELPVNSMGKVDYSIL